MSPAFMTPVNTANIGTIMGDADHTPCNGSHTPTVISTVSGGMASGRHSLVCSVVNAVRDTCNVAHDKLSESVVSDPECPGIGLTTMCLSNDTNAT